MGVSGMMCHSCLPLMWPLPPAPRVHCSCTRGGSLLLMLQGKRHCPPFMMRALRLRSHRRVQGHAVGEQGFRIGSLDL